MALNFKVLTDVELLDLLKEDSKGAFTEIYNRYWKKLLTVAANKLKSVDDAEEVIQDIFIVLWNRRAELEIKSALASYLAVSVKYRVIKILDKYYHQQKYINSLVHDHCVDDSTQEWLQFQELKEQMSVLVAALPEKCRIVYQLSRNSHFSQKEIAAELQISEKTVEAHIGKAIKTLRAGLTTYMRILL